MPSGVGVNEIENDISILALTPTVTTSGNVAIEFTSQSVLVTNIFVTDATGRELSALHYKTKSGINALNISSQNLANGVYFLTLQNSKQKITRRFVVNK